MADFAGAGAGTPLDLPQQARTRAVFVIAVGAGAQQEGALQGVERAVHRRDIGEGPEIVALAVACAAMLRQLRRGVIAREQDIGKRLVVAQQHIEARLHLLDVIGFKQQRLGFRLGRDEDHRGRERNHPRNAVRMAEAARIAGDAPADAARLADIEHLAILGDHAIDARSLGRMAQMGADDRRSLFDEGGRGIPRRLVEIERGGAFGLGGLAREVFILEAIRFGLFGGIWRLAAHARDLDELRKDAMAGAKPSRPAGENPARQPLLQQTREVLVKQAKSPDALRPQSTRPAKPDLGKSRPSGPAPGFPLSLSPQTARESPKRRGVECFLALDWRAELLRVGSSRVRFSPVWARASRDASKP